MPTHTDFLLALEQSGVAIEREQLLLWPRTPMTPTHQDKILERVGVSDWDMSNRASRPAVIRRFLDRLRREDRIPPSFSLLDVACGDAIVLLQLQRAFSEARCFGVDCAKGHFETHAVAERAGVHLYRGFLQHLVERQATEPFHVVLMLNTYRGWSSADLRADEVDLPRKTDEWLFRSARFVVVTAIESQIRGLQRQGIRVTRLGKGEDDSQIIAFRGVGATRSDLRGAIERLQGIVAGLWGAAR